MTVALVSPGEFLGEGKKYQAYISMLFQGALPDPCAAPPGPAPHSSLSLSIALLSPAPPFIPYPQPLCAACSYEVQPTRWQLLSWQQGGCR